jgi:hypothetical protein
VTAFKNPRVTITFAAVEQDPLGGSVTKNVTLLDNKEGFLECKAHGATTFWCEHIKEVVMKELDRVSFVPDDVDIYDHHGYQVPIFPEKLHLFGRVVLNGIVKNVHAVKVYFIPEGMPDEMDEHYLGFLHSGEGRKVLRSMLLDFARAYTEQPDFQCRSSSHDFQAQMKWEQIMAQPPDSVIRIATAFSLLNSQMCIACADPINADTDDNSDLIPTK